MKAKTSFLFDICVILVVLGIATACNTPHGSSIGVNGNPTNITATAGMDVATNINVAVTGSVDPSNTSNWSAGFVITFKDAPESSVIGQLAQAGGVRARATDSLEWQFPNVKSPADPAFQKAILAAAGSGDFTVKPLK